MHFSGGGNMEWAAAFFKNIGDIYNHPGYLDNITAGLHVMALEVILVTVLLTRLLQHIDYKNTERKWLDTRKQLATALLVSGVQLAKSTLRLFSSEDDEIILNADFVEQLAQIETAIDNVNDQIMVHLNALTPSLVQEISILSAKLAGYQHTIGILKSRAGSIEIPPFQADAIDAQRISGEALARSPERWDALAQSDWTLLSQTYFAKMCMYAIRHGHDIAGYLTELVDRFYDAEDLPARWETSAADWRRKLMADNDALIDCEKQVVEKGIVLMTVN